MKSGRFNLTGLHDPRDPRDMSRALIDDICRQFPGAVASDPTTELDSWKVGGKMFATFGTKINGVSVKTDSPATAAMLIDAGIGTKAKYFHASWITLPFETAPDEMQHRLHTSYDLIRKALPKRVQNAL